MDRNAVMWTLVVFFGASILFATINRETSDEGIGVSLGLQALAGLILVAAIVIIVRRQGK